MLCFRTARRTKQRMVGWKERGCRYRSIDELEKLNQPTKQNPRINFPSFKQNPPPLSTKAPKLISALRSHTRCFATPLHVHTSLVLVEPLQNSSPQSMQYSPIDSAMQVSMCCRRNPTLSITRAMCRVLVAREKPERTTLRALTRRHGLGELPEQRMRNRP